MLRKIQKKPLAFRRKLLISGIIAALIIILPVWLLNIRNTLKNSQKKSADADQSESQKMPDLEQVKDELSDNLREFKKILEIIKNQANIEAQTKTSDSQMLTLPQE